MAFGLGDDTERTGPLNLKKDETKRKMCDDKTMGFLSYFIDKCSAYLKTCKCVKSILSAFQNLRDVNLRIQSLMWDHFE